METRRTVFSKINEGISTQIHIYFLFFSFPPCLRLPTRIFTIRWILPFFFGPISLHDSLIVSNEREKIGQENPYHKNSTPNLLSEILCQWNSNPLFISDFSCILFFWCRTINTHFVSSFEFCFRLFFSFSDSNGSRKSMEKFLFIIQIQFIQNDFISK